MNFVMIVCHLPSCNLRLYFAVSSAIVFTLIFALIMLNNLTIPELCVSVTKHTNPSDDPYPFLLKATANY